MSVLFFRKFTCFFGVFCFLSIVRSDVYATSVNDGEDFDEERHISHLLSESDSEISQSLGHRGAPPKVARSMYKAQYFRLFHLTYLLNFMEEVEEKIAEKNNLMVADESIQRDYKKLKIKLKSISLLSKSDNYIVSSHSLEYKEITGLFNIYYRASIKNSELNLLNMCNDNVRYLDKSINEIEKIRKLGIEKVRIFKENCGGGDWITLMNLINQPYETIDLNLSLPKLVNRKLENLNSISLTFKSTRDYLQGKNEVFSYEKSKRVKLRLAVNSNPSKTDIDKFVQEDLCNYEFKETLKCIEDFEKRKYFYLKEFKETCLGKIKFDFGGNKANL